MKKIIIVSMLIALAGCSNTSTENGMKAFINGCAKPVSGSVTFNQWGNTVKFECSEFKHMEDK